MASFALLTADTTHVGATRLRDALVNLGHTVTLFADSGLAGHDFSAFSAIVATRTTFASRVAIATRLRTELAAGKPVMFGGWESGMSTSSTNTGGLVLEMKMTSGQNLWSSGGDTYHRVRRAIDPAEIFAGYNVNSYGLQGTTAPGTGFASVPACFGARGSSSNLVNCIYALAVEPDSADVVYGAKVVWHGWMSLSNHDFSADGLVWLERSVNWLFAAEPSPTPQVGKFFYSLADSPVAAGVPAELRTMSNWFVYTEDVNDGGSLGRSFHVYSDAPAGGNALSYALLAPGFVADGEALLLLSGLVSSGAANGPGALFRWSERYGTQVGYAIRLASQTSLGLVLRLQRYNADNTRSILIDVVRSSTTPHGPWWLRVRFVGTVIQAKVWDSGVAEPVDWLLTYDTAADSIKYTTGWAGLFQLTGTVTNDNARFYQIGVASDGGTAPAEPVPVDQPPDTPTLTVADLTPTSARLVGSPYSHPQGKPHVATEWDLGGTVVATGPVTEYLEVGRNPATQYTGRRVRYRAGE
jgi:hypothetical protein